MADIQTLAERTAQRQADRAAAKKAAGITRPASSGSGGKPAGGGSGRG